MPTARSQPRRRAPARTAPAASLAERKGARRASRAGVGPRRNLRRGATGPVAPVTASTGARAGRALDPAAAERRRRIGRRFLRGGLKVGFTLGLAYAVLLGVQGVHDYATTSPRFEVSTLVFEPTRHVDEGRLRSLLALEPGTNILALDLEALSARVAEDPWVQRAQVSRQLPDTLEVSVVEHEEAAVVLAGHFYLANREGQLFKRLEAGERGELPIMTGLDREALLGDRAGAEARIRRGLEVLDSYQKKRRPRLSEIHLGPHGDVTLYTAEAGTQIRLGRGEVEPRLVRYDTLRAALGERAERLAVVHLDHEREGEDRERVVASFFDPGDEASLLAAAQPEAEEAAADEAPSTTGPTHAPRKRSIPRAY